MADVLQHGQKLIRRLEATALQRRGRHLGKCFNLLCRIGSKVDFGALDAGMAEPKRNLALIPGGLKCVTRQSSLSDALRALRKDRGSQKLCGVTDYPNPATAMEPSPALRIIFHSAYYRVAE